MSDWINIESDPKHVSREKEKAKKLKKSQWWLNKLQQGKCHYCEGIFPAEEITMDHIVPLSRGGASSKGNIVACCRPCNGKKKYLTPVDMLLDQLKKEEENNADV